MIAVDTNIIVRYLTRDDEPQYQISRNVIETQDIFVPDSVVLETEWVLRYAYDFDSSEIRRALRRFFGMQNVHLSSPDILAQAIDWHEKGMDFADALHLALSSRVETLVTFDKQFVKKAKGLSNCAVREPG